MFDKKTEHRPWGNFVSIAENNDFKVKIILIKQEQSISYQYHFKRSEHWIIVKGIGELTVDGKVSLVKKNDQVFIPFESKHKIKNTGDEDLIFIEVQTGEYFGEDDIVRISDDYGRA